MIIETKFNPKDEIWHVDVDSSTLERIKHKHIIADIEIEADEYGSSVWYHMDESWRSFQEEDCFSTQQEAQDECDRRNKAREE
jgi:hypothetical protein